MTILSKSFSEEKEKALERFSVTQGLSLERFSVTQGLSACLSVCLSVCSRVDYITVKLCMHNS